MIVIAIIAYIFWGILGMIFWVPLLFRVVAGFCGSLVYNMVVNNPSKIHDSKVSLDLAISFYVKGFQTIYSSLYETAITPKDIKNEEFRLIPFFGQVLWTIFFWGLTIYPFYKHEISNYIKTFNYSTNKYIEESEQYLSINDTLSAINILTQAIDKYKFNADLYFKIGMLYYKKADFKNAAKNLESSIKLDSTKYGEDPDIAWKTGKSYSSLKQYEKAITYYTTMLKYTPKFADGYIERGFCYSNLNENDLALKDFDAAINLDPNSGIAYSNKAAILYNKGEKTEACALYDLAIRVGFLKAQAYKNQYCK